MQHHRQVTLGLALLVSACGSDETAGPPPAEFDELCGEEGPVRLLAIDPERTLLGVREAEFGDRTLFALNFETDPESFEAEIWSVGPCGEDPIQLIDGVEGFILGYDPWPDVPFVCDPDSGIRYALDPSGTLPPNPVFETRGCFALETPEGLVTILGEGDTGPLVLQRWPDNPLTQTAEQVVLLDEARASVPTDPRARPELEMLTNTDTEVFAITSTDELVAIALDDLTITELASNVREFDHDFGVGRWIVYQGTQITGGAAEWPEGPIFLLDLDSGISTQVAETSLAFTIPTSLQLHRVGLLHLRIGAYDDPAGLDRYFRLSTLESVSVGGSLSPLGTLDETRALFSSFPFAGPPYVVIDVESFESTLLYDGELTDRPRFDTDGFTFLRREGGELVRMSYWGVPEVLAKHASRGWEQAPSGRIVTPFAVDDEDVGDLVLVEPGTLVETSIVEGAYDFSLGLREDEGLELTYALADPDPERYGIWRARLAD
jgi:hypothetical protein